MHTTKTIAANQSHSVINLRKYATGELQMLRRVYNDCMKNITELQQKLDHEEQLLFSCLEKIKKISTE